MEMYVHINEFGYKTQKSLKTLILKKQNPIKTSSNTQEIMLFVIKITSNIIVWN